MLALGLPGACSTSGTCTAPPQQARGRLGLARGLAPCRAVARWRDLPDGGTVTLAPYEGAEEAAAPAPPRMPRGSAVLAEAPAKLPLPANPGDVGSPSAVPLRSGSGVPDTARCLLRLHELCCAPEQPFSDWRLDGVTLNGGEQLRFATVGEALRAPEAAVAAASQAPAPAAPASAAPATTTAGPSASSSATAEPRLAHSPQPARAASPSNGRGRNHSVPPPPVNASVELLTPPHGALEMMGLMSGETTSTSVERVRVAHPGSLVSSVATVERDAAKKICTVTLKTSLRMTEASPCLDMADMEELAWVSVRETASDLITSLNRRSAVPAHGREERHRFVCHMLRTGHVHDATKMENGFGHISYLVTLEDQETGKRMKALFKPRVEGDCEGWHRVPIEAAAYQLNLLLGMDYVPPAVYRPECDVDWHHYPLGGTFMYWCQSGVQLDAVPMNEWSVPAQVVLSDTRVLDVLLQNSDRHAGHFLCAEHWADGKYSPQGWRGVMAPVLIDQAAGFRSDAYVGLEHENSFLTGPTRRISAKTYLRLRFLDRATLSHALKEFITPEEISSLLARRDTMLAFFDGQVNERGFSKVVMEEGACCVLEP